MKLNEDEQTTNQKLRFTDVFYIILNEKILVCLVSWWSLIVGDLDSILQLSILICQKTRCEILYKIKEYKSFFGDLQISSPTFLSGH